MYVWSAAVFVVGLDVFPHPAKSGLSHSVFSSTGTVQVALLSPLAPEQKSNRMPLDPSRPLCDVFFVTRYVFWQTWKTRLRDAAWKFWAGGPPGLG